MCRDAFAALGRHDFVFGPAADGGYWLVGAKRSRVVPQGLFENVRWSNEHALSDTVAGLPKNARVARLGELDDIDDGPAYHAWRRRQAPDIPTTSSTTSPITMPLRPVLGCSLLPQRRYNRGEPNGIDMESIYYVLSWLCHRRCDHCYDTRFRPYVRENATRW